MHASAKTDFEPNFLDTGAEITVRVDDNPAFLLINFDFRQQFAHERLAFEAQFAALAAAENKAAADYLVFCLVAYHALLPFTQYFTLKCERASTPQPNRFAPRKSHRQVLVRGQNGHTPRCAHKLAG